MGPTQTSHAAPLLLEYETNATLGWFLSATVSQGGLLSTRNSSSSSLHEDSSFAGPSPKSLTGNGGV